jgi:hypothetical protein
MWENDHSLLKRHIVPFSDLVSKGLRKDSHGLRRGTADGRPGKNGELSGCIGSSQAAGGPRVDKYRARAYC